MTIEITEEPGGASPSPSTPSTQKGQSEMRRDERAVSIRESIGERCRECGGRIKSGDNLRQLVRGVEHVNVNDCRTQRAE